MTTDSELYNNMARIELAKAATKYEVGSLAEATYFLAQAQVYATLAVASATLEAGPGRG